ncbi:hypothetical protein [Sandarakinorhabdus sp.]|uniref:hypothetical protein n=1 Tax=Sandarakinorhabdus sp. TaxID=1916663 RepID=UPI003561AFCA
MRLNVLLVSAALAFAASPGAAQVLFSQNFNSLPQGIPALGVPGFTTTGTVDVVTSGNFSIDCVGNAGKCLDIDGTPGPGSLTTNTINYLAGRQLTLSFDVSGNQRDATTDRFIWTTNFGQTTDITGFACLTGFDPGQCNPGDYTGLSTLGAYSENIAGTRNWLSP